MCQHADDGLTLRGTGRDGRTSDREPWAFEVDVVEFVPVDKASGGDVTDLRVVFPAVPESTHDFDELCRFVHESGNLGAVRRSDPRWSAATKLRRLKPVGEIRAWKPARPRLT